MKAQRDPDDRTCSGSFQLLRWVSGKALHLYCVIELPGELIKYWYPGPTLRDFETSVLDGIWALMIFNSCLGETN